MSYESQTAAISRVPITVVEITLDFCSLTYGVSPCTATGAVGSECYNTFPTCHDKENYDKTTKVYRFSSFDAPQPIDAKDSRPYLNPITYLPTEIKNNFNIRSRIFAKMIDEPDFDRGIDPYVATRVSQQGTFWKKLIARNPNYKNKPVVIKEGYENLPIADYEPRFTGLLENIEIVDKGIIKVEIVGLLANLRTIETPVDLGIELVADITEASISLVVSEASDLDSSGYIRIDDEIIKYTGITLAQNQLTGLTRGEEFTTAATHDAEVNVQPCRLFDFDNPYTHLQTILAEGGVPGGNVDTDAFDFWAEWPHVDIDYRTLLIEPVTLDTLFWELVNVMDVVVWENEEQKVTIRKNMPNNPDQTTVKVSDSGNLINATGETDLNEVSRKTRVIAYWNKPSLTSEADIHKVEEYDNILVSIDQEAESEESYNDIVEEKLFIRWISLPHNVSSEITKEYVELLTSRRLLRKRDALPIISFDLEKKDEGILTGDNVQLSTDEILDIDGNPLVDLEYLVVKRKPTGNKFRYSVQRLPQKKICLISDVDFNDDDAVAESQEVAGAGNLTLTDSPVSITNPRKVSISTTGDATGVTITVTGKDVDGGAQVSAAFAGGDQDRVTAVDGGAVDLIWSEVSQIAVSGAFDGFVEAGIFLDFDNATIADKQYGFITRADGLMDDTIDGYYIW